MKFRFTQLPCCFICQIYQPKASTVRSFPGFLRACAVMHTVLEFLLAASQHLGQCLAHCRCLINIGWTNDRIGTCPFFFVQWEIYCDTHSSMAFPFDKVSWGSIHRAASFTFESFITFYECRIMYWAGSLTTGIDVVVSVLAVANNAVMNIPVCVYLCGFGFMSRDRYSIDISWTKGVCFDINVADLPDRVGLFAFPSDSVCSLTLTSTEHYWNVFTFPTSLVTTWCLAGVSLLFAYEHLFMFENSAFLCELSLVFCLLFLLSCWF